MTKFKCGFVTIVGRPNVGKSTLLNSLLEQKISIISKVPQTTRFIIRGILNLGQAQIIFVDTPGIHLFKHTLSSELNSLSFSSLEDIELILYVIDSAREPKREEEKIMDTLVKKRIPLIMALNKIDRSKKYISDYIDMWQEKSKHKRTSPLKYYLPISARRGTNLDKLKKLILEFLPLSRPFYDKDTVTDFPLSYRVADLIREKVYTLLREELPHNVAVEVEEIIQEEKLVKIQANILVSKKSQKPIVIGANANTIKEIGILARADLETLFGKKVFLELWVKLEPNWQDKPRILRELGYTGL